MAFFKEVSASYYKQYCAHEGVKPAIDLGRRELDHFTICHSCLETWPKYYFDQVHEKKRPLNQVSREWQEMTEQERFLLHQRLLREEKKWIKKWATVRGPSGYSEFAHAHESEFKELPFTERRKAIGQRWRALTDEEKSALDAAAEQKRKDYRLYKKKLPAFKQRQLVMEKKTTISKLKNASNRLKAPPNCFILFKTKFRQDLQNAGQTTEKDVMRQAGVKWKSMSDEEKAPFRAQFANLRKKYVAARKRQEEAAKSTEKPAKRPAVTPASAATPAASGDVEVPDPDSGSVSDATIESVDSKSHPTEQQEVA